MKKFEDYSFNLTFDCYSEKESDERLGELILYISDRCIDDRYYGATKLNKILYFSDFLFFKLYGKSITGAEYQRLDEGPAPKRLIPVQQKLIKEKRLIVKSVPAWNRTQKRSVSIENPNIDLFTAREISVVDQIIKEVWDKSGTQVSIDSHIINWEVYQDKESMPYESVHLSDKITFEDVKRAHELINEYGWTDI